MQTPLLHLLLPLLLSNLLGIVVMVAVSRTGMTVVMTGGIFAMMLRGMQEEGDTTIEIEISGDREMIDGCTVIVCILSLVVVGFDDQDIEHARFNKTREDQRFRSPIGLLKATPWRIRRIAAKALTNLSVKNWQPGKPQPRGECVNNNTQTSVSCAPCSDISASHAADEAVAPTNLRFIEILFV